MAKYDVCIKAFIKGNLGDDLFVYTLCNRYPNKKFVICGEKAYKTCFDLVPNLSYICYDTFLNKYFFRMKKIIPRLMNKFMELTKQKKRFQEKGLFFKLSNQASDNVLISGSVFMEPSQGADTKNSYYLEEKKYYDGHPYVMGCNFGPYVTEEYRKFYQECFNKASQVSFRENYSYNLFKGENIMAAPDILFAIDKTMAEPIKDKDYILVSVVDPNKDNNEAGTNVYVNSLLILLKKLIKLDKKIVLMGFCNFQGDNVINQYLKNQLRGSDKIKIVNYPDISASEAVGYIAGADFIVATRYHAMILGWVFGKSVLPIAYSKKMENVINDIEQDVEYTTINDISNYDFTELATKIVNNQTETYKIKNVEKLTYAASKHFNKLDELYK